MVRIVNNSPDSAALAAIRSDPNCYSLIEAFPGGFTPQFGGYVHDLSLAGGVRGDLDSGWFYDVSATVGRSNAQFYIYNTINPQLLWQRNDIDVYYEAGAYTETDRVVNFDLSKPFDSDSFGAVNVAVGLEYRDETFRIDNGEPNSFYIDPNLEHGLASQGFGVGSNGFPGFQPGDAGENTVRSCPPPTSTSNPMSPRTCCSAARCATRTTRTSATRSTARSPRACRWATTWPSGAQSAPASAYPPPGQANLRNVTTEFNMGFLSDIATLPPTNPIAQQKGAKALTPEESVNTTLGVVFDVGGVDVTVDYYRIEIEDRISFTSRFELDEADIAALLAAVSATPVASRRYGSSRTCKPWKASGIDVVATWPFELGSGSSNLTFAGNWSGVELTKFNSEFTSENRRLQIEEGRPESPLHADVDPHPGPLASDGAGTAPTASTTTLPTNDGSVAFYPDPSLLFDAEIAVDATDSLSLLFGLQNAFDEYPSTNPHGEVAGLVYPEQSPFGFNGGFYYLRAQYRMD